MSKADDVGKKPAFPKAGVYEREGLTKLEFMALVLTAAKASSEPGLSVTFCTKIGAESARDLLKELYPDE